MLLALTTADGRVFSVDVSPEMEMENLAALVEAETSIPASRQKLLFNGVPLLDPKKTLHGYGIKADDILLVLEVGSSSGGVGGPSAGSNRTSAPAMPDQAENLRQALLADPTRLAEVAASNPALADAARNDPAKFRQLIVALQAEHMRLRQSEQDEIARLEADPMDVEAQRKIEAMIQQKNIQSNMADAMEYNPAAFARVVMLYIDCEVNGHPVKAFVDSGAQATIMSPECAEQCNIMRLCDTRFAGMAKGVGTAKILGRVHSADLKLLASDAQNDQVAGKSKQQDLFLQCSFTIMEGKDVDMLLGLDMLKRFQAVIDLHAGVLRIGDFQTTFLAEKDLPAKARGLVEEPPKEPAAKPADSKPATTNTVATAPAVAQKSISQSSHPEASVEALMTLGAGREQAVAALNAANGNVDVAAGLLFSLD